MDILSLSQEKLWTRGGCYIMQCHDLPWNLSHDTHTFSLVWHVYCVQYFNTNAVGPLYQLYQRCYRKLYYLWIWWHIMEGAWIDGAWWIDRAWWIDQMIVWSQRRYCSLHIMHCFNEILSNGKDTLVIRCRHSLVF